MPYNFISDPSHGWLRVKTKELEKLGILDKISTYSYLSPTGKSVYLEEDSDMAIFLRAMNVERLQDLPTGVRMLYTDKHSVIRTYQPFEEPSDSATITVEQIEREIARLQKKLEVTKKKAIDAATPTPIAQEVTVDTTVVSDDLAEDDTVTDQQLDNSIAELKQAWNG